MRDLLAAGTERPGATLRLISLAPANPRDLPRGIVWQPASEWLLSERNQLPVREPKRRSRKRSVR
jgi:hypothetical protein